MLLYLAIIAAVLILAVVLRFLAEPGPPDNGVTHYQDGKRDGEAGPEDKPPGEDRNADLDDPAEMSLAA